MGQSSSYTKEEVEVAAGDLFSEELWQQFSSRDGTISHKQLFVLKNTLSYTQRLKMTNGGFEMVTTESDETKVVAQQDGAAIDASLLLLSGDITSLANFYSEKLLILNIGSCT